jgi:hypothetical protein
MSYSDIASAVFGYGYMRKTARGFIADIRNAMNHTRTLADANGLLLIPLRKPTKANEKNRWQVIGWKIAVMGFDEKYIADELLFRKRMGEARSLSTIRFISAAHDNKLISEEKYKELAGELQLQLS